MPLLMDPILYLRKDGTWFELGDQIARGVAMITHVQGSWFVTSGWLHPISGAAILVELSDDEHDRLIANANQHWVSAEP